MTKCPKCKGYGNKTYWNEKGMLIIEIDHTCDYCLGKGYVTEKQAKTYVDGMKQIKEVLGGE